MTRRSSLHEELEKLRAELEALRKAPAAAAAAAAPEAEAPSTITGQLAEANRLMREMLDEAEDTVIEHPVAAVAGALALGIVIGRLTAR